jgi:hypothetical protein
MRHFAFDAGHFCSGLEHWVLMQTSNEMAAGHRETTSLTVACHCGATTYSFSVPAESLPLEAYLCHCNISRRISGLLCTSYVPIPTSNAPPDLTPLTAYKSSDILKRHFCSTCGTQLFLEYNADGHFEVSTGTVDRADGVIKFNGNMWIEDTRDGGASVWFREWDDGKPVERWLVAPQKSPQVPLDWKLNSDTHERSASAGDESKLRARCHCGGIEFFISRPNADSLKARSPFSDLLVPYSSGESAENPQNEPWWLSKDRNRYVAGTCSCVSCRSVSGFDLTEWAFVPATNVTLGNGQSFRQQLFGTAETYKSSGGVTRWFCSRCGANIFWIGNWRPSLLDVAVGLLDAESGARAEEWLEWITGRVSFREEAHNETLIAAVEKGLNEWKQAE